jgi:hypothetical protein
MGFWDKVKQFFGAGPAPGSFGGLSSQELENRVRLAMLASLKNRASFGPEDIAEKMAPAAHTPIDVALVADVLENLHERQFFGPFDYTKTWREPPLCVSPDRGGRSGEIVIGPGNRNAARADPARFAAAQSGQCDTADSTRCDSSRRYAVSHVAEPVCRARHPGTQSR